MQMADFICLVAGSMILEEFASINCKGGFMLKRNIALLAVLLLLFVGCAGMQTMTTKQQAAVWLEIYNAQYDDVYSVMTNPNSTPAQKSMALKKKEILIQLWPLLRMYVATIDGGVMPTSAQVVSITELINELTAFAIAR